MAVSFKVLFGNASATAKQLDNIEEISVAQEIDMAWEARLRFPVCLDDNGCWTGDNARFLDSFSRVRVEVSAGNGFVPLIDGPVVGRDSERSSEPGQSTITVVVQDDSVYLNRDERFERFSNLSDHEVAERLFRDADEIRETDVERTPPHTDSLPSQVVRRGTAMSLLRTLARRQGMHAYVLPGTSPANSKGCFKALPTEPSGLPPLVLLGRESNVRSLHMSSDEQCAGTFEAHALNVSDKGVISSTSRFRDVDLLGSRTREPVNAAPTARLAPPRTGNTVDLDRLTAGRMGRASYSLRVTGEVIQSCYAGVLRPYEVVSTRGINDRDSGRFLIHKVTHTLSRSTYGQAFTLRRNAQSAGACQSVSDLIGRIW